MNTNEAPQVMTPDEYAAHLRAIMLRRTATELRPDRIGQIDRRLHLAKPRPAPRRPWLAPWPLFAAAFAICLALAAVFVARL